MNNPLSFRPPGAFRWTPRQIALASLLVLAVLLCWLPAFQSVADRYVDDGLQRSLLSFATARALHSVVSVLQGTELAVQPMGVGLTLTLGQVLAPISDLVAQFADWMLWASIAFGLQKLLLSMGGSYGVTGVLTLIALAWLLLRWRQQTVPTWLSLLLVVLLFTRLVMPITIIGSEALFQHFMAGTYQENQIATEGAVGQLQQFDVRGPAKADHAPNMLNTPADTAPPAAAQAAPNESTSLWERFKQWGQQAQQSASQTASGVQSVVRNPGDALRDKFSELQQQLDQQVERLVTLMVVFALQTLVIPLALFWALLQLCKGLLAGPRQALPK
ncbi:hypothetical protein M2375_002739 [Comamonas sp. BIGb0152]|uniref:hypothetical protein n=1 Tax=Comamonas sp. BIGb0152 TaxID=2940601 RepID=UPI002168ADD2|nr:hypothetical protein [Comamonas sp. BIGb0152]MCS4294506.1 hypothetical protein [Comamonas sp. BIGb0152]